MHVDCLLCGGGLYLGESVTENSTVYTFISKGGNLCLKAKNGVPNSKIFLI